MKISIYKKLLEIINNERESFDTIIEADNSLDLNVTSEDIISYLEFSNDDNTLNGPLVGNIIITEGDILSILKVINDLKNYTGEYILYINNDNVGTITYFIKKVNDIYKELEIELNLTIDYSENYNKYLNELVTVIGSEKFISESEEDFSNANHIIV